jgi:hypothetical protein
MLVKPPGPRHAVTEEADGLAIRIPAKRNLFIIGFLSLWLCVWAVAEVLASIAFFTAAEMVPGASAFLLFWLCGWTVGGAFAIFVWLWQVKGCEVVTVSPTALSIRREVLGYGVTKNYDVAEVRGLRIAPLTFNPFDFRSGLAFWGIGGGMLAFDYGFKTYRFGGGVDEAEVRIIHQTIISRLPPVSSATIA